MINYFQKIKPTLVFDLKRFLKNKVWIITTAVFTAIILFFYIFFAIFYLKGHTISIALMVTIPNAIALIYIGIISLIIMNQLFIQDKTSGIFGLEKRMGRKANQLFLTKYLVQKILVYSWIIVNFILFLLFVPTIAQFDAKFLLAMSLGIFALFLFEWFFTGILYLTSLSKNTKLLSAIAGVLMALLVFFPLVGPAFREFGHAIPDQQDIMLFYYKQKTENIRLKYNNGILEQMNKDIYQLYQNENDGALYKYDLDDTATIFSFLDQGIVTKNKINLLMDNSKVQERIKNIVPVETNINFWYQNSFTHKFFTIIETSIQLKQSSFVESWFNKNNLSNYQASGQLNDFLSTIENYDFLNQLNKETSNHFQFEELKAISKLVYEQFINYYLIKVPYTSGISNGIPSGSGFWNLLTNNEVNNTVNINEGERLFTRILTRSISYYDINRMQSSYSSSYIWNLEDFNKSYNNLTKTNISLKFILNPFNALLGGSLYSGIDSFANDAKINNSYYPLDWQFLKTLSVREIKVNYSKTGRYIQINNFQESKKLISIGWLYGFYVILQGLTVGITFLFNTKKEFLSNKSYQRNQKTKDSNYIYQ